MANITHFIGKWVQRLIIIGNIITHFRTGTPVLDQPESIEGQRVLKNVENRAFFLFTFMHLNTDTETYRLAGGHILGLLTQ
jgi:hypothetical protein